MRVTQGMMVGNFLNNLNNNYRTMDKIQEQLSTGRKLNRPSDDPVGIVSSLRMRTSLTESEKYLANAAEGREWLETTDISLGEAGNILNKVRELTIQGANDSLPVQSRTAIAKEIGQLREQLLQVANSTHDGRFIFGGYHTTDKPFAEAAGVVTYEGDSGTISYEVGVDINIPINVNGDDAFINGQDVFQLLTDIEDDLNNGTTVDLSGADITALDAAIDNILSTRAEVGARINRLDLTTTRLEDSNLNVSTLLSKTEDINVAETITQLKMQENTYRTALSAGARIIQPTLMDFLR